MSALVDPAFWRGRRVLVTGHTGFKGAWLWLWLADMGAEVFGFSREPVQGLSLFGLTGGANLGNSAIGDLAETALLREYVLQARPEIVIHLAAQAFVRRAYREPVETFATNVGGTVNLLEALRGCTDLGTILVVTTDKVYQNEGSAHPFRETDSLGGREPYSASKVGQEVVAQAYRHSYFEGAGVTLATVRGGNVIGGGDYGEDRLVPDVVRAVQEERDVVIRHPDATRPWQHVFDCLSGYLVYVQSLATNPALPRSLNIGPSHSDSLTVGEFVAALCAVLGRPGGWRVEASNGPREATTLALDVTLARSLIGWSDRLAPDQAIAATADWYRRQMAGEDMRLASLAALSGYVGSGRNQTGMGAGAPISA